MLAWQTLNERPKIEFVANLQLGTDVVEEKAALQRAEKEQRDAQLTVANLCALWLETDALRSRMRGPRFGTLRDPKNIKQNEGQINRHINPLIGSVKINELTRKQVEKMRDDIASGKTAVDVKTGLRGRARVTFHVSVNDRHLLCTNKLHGLGDIRPFLNLLAARSYSVIVLTVGAKLS